MLLLRLPGVASKSIYSQVFPQCPFSLSDIIKVNGCSAKALLDEHFKENFSNAHVFSNQEMCVFVLETFGVFHVCPEYTEYKDKLVALNAINDLLTFRCELDEIFKAELQDISLFLLIGLFSISADHPARLASFLFPYYIKIIEHWDPPIKSFGASGLCWLISKPTVEIGDRWQWIIKDILTATHLYYFDSLDVLQPSAELYLKLQKHDPLLLLERFLNAIYLASERYKSTEAWMVSFIKEMVAFSSLKKQCEFFLLCWPSWIKFFSRMAINTPPLGETPQQHSKEILLLMLENRDFSGFLRANHKEAVKLLPIALTSTRLYKKWLDVSSVDENTLQDELLAIHPSLTLQAILKPDNTSPL